MGRTEEPLAESRRCLELEPSNILFNVHLGWHYLYAHQYDQAVKQLKNTLEMDSNFAQTHHWLGLAYEQQRSEEHTSELQSRLHLVCRLLLEKKKKKENKMHKRIQTTYE